MSGRKCDVVAYLSLLEGSGLYLTLAEITWENGEREVRGWALGESDKLYDEVVGRLRIGINAVEDFDRMAVMEVRLAKPGEDGPSPQRAQDDLGGARGRVRLRRGEVLDGLAEAITGTRESVLGDDGRRRAQLCTAFPSSDHRTPAIIWALSRPLALGLSALPDLPQPTAPVQRRRAPGVDDVPVLNAASPDLS